MAQINEEINIGKELRHPNIVNLFEVYKTETNIYLIFEYCGKGDLEKYLNEYYKDKETSISKLPEKTA